MTEAYFELVTLTLQKLYYWKAFYFIEIHITKINQDWFHSFSFILISIYPKFFEILESNSKISYDHNL